MYIPQRELHFIPYHVGTGGRGLVGELEATVTQRLLPRMGALLADEAPLPLYALRLLASLLEARHAWALALARCDLQAGQVLTASGEPGQICVIACCAAPGGGGGWGGCSFW